MHLYGQMAPMDELHGIAERNGLVVIEDFAQAQGARQAGRSAGAWSLAAGTSFYPGKNLGAAGDAGAVVTDDPHLAETVRAMRNYGSPRKYEHPVPGFNSRLDTLQAVVLRAKLKRLAGWNALRRRAAERYDRLLAGLEAFRPVRTRDGNEPVFHLYVGRVAGGASDRERVLQALHRENVGAGVHYPTPLHLVGAYASHGHRRGEFPAAEEAADRIISLPLFPQITAGQQERVADALRRALGCS